jgi:hypothetical protein
MSIIPIIIATLFCLILGVTMFVFGWGFCRLYYKAGINYSSTDRAPFISCVHCVHLDNNTLNCRLATCINKHIKLSHKVGEMTDEVARAKNIIEMVVTSHATDREMCEWRVIRNALRCK